MHSKNPVGARALVMVLAAVLVMTIWAGQPDGAMLPGAVLRAAAAPAQYMLSGRVYEGATGVEPPISGPIQGVTVSLYCSYNHGQRGTFLRSTTTDDQGWFGLNAYDDDGCEYFNIIETDPGGYVSDGATTVGGDVIDANWIEYIIPLESKTLTGNKFWDRRPVTDTPTATRTATPTRTPTRTMTSTRTPTLTHTPTATRTHTPTPTATRTVVPTPTNTHTPPPAPTHTQTPTKTPTRTVTSTRTPTITYTPTPTVTRTQMPTETDTPTATTTGTAVRTPTATRTYAPPPTSTWTPTSTSSVGCPDLLINGDFETGGLASWERDGSVWLGPGRTDGHGVWLGGSDDAAGELWQWVGIPAGAGPVRLAFWWMTESEEEQPGDALEVIVQYGDEQADIIRTLPAVTPPGRWQEEVLDLTAYAGREVAVTFLVHTDGEIPTTFGLDDVSLQACGERVTPSPTATPTATAGVPAGSTWTFSGWAEGQSGEPLAGMEVRLLGSEEPGEAGHLLDWTKTQDDGSFLLRFDRYDTQDPGLGYVQVAVLHPGDEIVEVLSESGGERVGEDWLAFAHPTPGHYGGNLFRIARGGLQGPPPIKLCAIADTFVEQGNPAANHGGDVYDSVGYSARGCGGACRSLVRFNLDWLPGGISITAAEFQAYQRYGWGRSTVDVRVQRVIGSWGEKSVTWANQPGDGDPATSIALGTTAGYRYWKVDALVQGWRDGSFSNDGLALRGDEEVPEWQRDFDSRESANPPRLVLYRGGGPFFTGPSPSTTPYLTLTPNQGEAGSLFWARGYNLKPATTYYLFWDVFKPGAQLAQVTTDALGSFGVQVSVPAAAEVGFHHVLLYWQDVIEQMNKLQAQAVFLVEPPCWSVKPPFDLNPQISVNPAQGPSNGGNTVQVIGKGWSANTPVKLFWDDPKLCSGNNAYCLGQVTTDAQGKFVTSFTVPGGQSVTGHQVIARNHPFTAPVQQAAADYRTTDPPSPPANDHQPPTVFVNHSVGHLYSGGPPITVYFRAVAWDPLTTPTSYNGITQIDIWAWPVTGFYTLIHKRCQLTGWTPSMSCWQVENGPWDPSITGFYYFAQARDRSNNVANSPVKVAWLINDGPDSDNDGLSDKVENASCSNPNNPDTDRDNLLDGWEVEGVEFADGYYMDLPSMGANPCMKDLFVEVDWTPGRRPIPAQDFQPVINAYQDHNIRLHIDYGQWGGGEEVTLASTTAANVAARNNFDPQRIWAFHYGVFRPPLPGTGSNFCERGKVFFIGDAPGTAAQTFMHELGHCTGFGHGGMTGLNTQKRSGTAAQQAQWGFQWVWYDQDSVATNNKPNYLSVMNYNWNGLVYVPAANCAGTNCFVFLYDYSEQALPTLNESNLDERANSAFVQALRNYPLPPNAPANGVPLAMYACRDPDENNALYDVATDGHRMIARFRAGDPWPIGWQFTNLPAQDANGIDWDCDGRIEASVRGNVNGCSGACFFFHNPQTDDETLAGADDWTRIPSLDPCLGDAWFGSGFLSAAHNPPCQSNGWAPASYPPDDRPWLHAIPAEYCNGEDDNGNGRVDEGCSDRDEDGVVDDVDNCVYLPNPDQGDGDGDGLGDACAGPPSPPSGLIAVPTDGGVQLFWEPVDAAGGVGYNVYRFTPGSDELRYLGTDWPATLQPAFLDDAGLASPSVYYVTAVNRYGLESETSEPVTVAFGPRPAYLPLVVRNGS